jgi:hypothetical protein
MKCWWCDVKKWYRGKNLESTVADSLSSACGGCVAIVHVSPLPVRSVTILTGNQGGILIPNGTHCMIGWSEKYGGERKVQWYYSWSLVLDIVNQEQDNTVVGARANTLPFARCLRRLATPTKTTSTEHARASRRRRPDEDRRDPPLSSPLQDECSVEVY